MPRVSDNDVTAYSALENYFGDMARELIAARKMVEAARDHGRWCSIKLSCRLCAALREYDAGESEAQPEPRKPSPLEALEQAAREYLDGGYVVTWAAIIDCIQRARRASGE